MNRAVTLEDFIMPKFRGKDPKDYEFRGDGEIVRKDRWETAIHRIRNFLIEKGKMENTDQFEIDEVVKAVKGLILQPEDSCRTDEEIINQTEALAKEFALLNGWNFEDDYVFHCSDNPRAVLMFKIACIAQELLTSTDVNNSLDEWCETMNRPKSKCGCPDCGSSLIG